jgi:hypothetical protein
MAPPLTEWDSILRECEEYDLLQHDPELLAALRGINPERPTSIDQKVLEHVVKPKLEAYRAFHKEYPFVVAPVGVLDQGVVRVATQFADGTPLMLGEHELSHTGIIGRTGAGKSSFLGPLVEYALQHARVIDLDLKHDRPWVQLHPGTIRIDSTTPIALLARDEHLTPSEQARLIVSDYLEVFWGAAGQSGAILKPLEELLSTNSAPSLSDWQEAIRRGPKTEAARTAIDRFDAIRLEYPGIFHAGDEHIPIRTVHDSSLYDAPTSGLTPATRFVLWHLVHRRFVALLKAGHRDRLHTLIVLDEGDKSLTKRQTTVTGTPSLPIQMITQGREVGMSTALCSTSAAELDPVVRANLFLKVILPLGDGQEVTEISKALRLTPAQTEYVAKRLTRGTAILSYPTWKHPVLATFAPFTRAKTLAPEELQEINEREAARCPRTAAAREAMASHPAPALVSAPSPPPTVAAVVEQAPPKRIRKSERQGPLTAIEQRLVDYIAANGVVLTTECQHDLTLHPQQVARATTKCLTLGLTTRATIRCRRGHGGSGVAHALTPAGLALATTKQLRTTGNGGHQHAFLATRIARAIPNAQLELSLNGKSIDVVIAYDKSAHAPLIKSIGAPIALNDGDLIAIEVEVSSPAKTLASNVRKNTAVGIAYNIIAVLPNTLASAKKIVKTLDAALRARVTVVDALELLNQLQERS